MKALKVAKGSGVPNKEKIGRLPQQDLEEIAKIKDQKIDLRRLILASDSISPHDLMENGYMESIVQKAIDCGFEPIKAIQMATLNVAEHFAIDNFLGGIAPGRYADLVIIPVQPSPYDVWALPCAREFCV